LAAIAAEYACPLLKPDESSISVLKGDDRVYIRPCNGWPEPIPEVMLSYFSNTSMAPNKPLEDGTFIYLDGYRKTNILL
jgi:hypothetical protein